MITSITDVSPTIVRIRVSKNTSAAERSNIIRRASSCNNTVSMNGRTITIRSHDGDVIPAWAYEPAWGDTVAFRPDV
jgi:hypothetical protein